jgi:Domain of unknown function (DUF4383)
MKAAAIVFGLIFLLVGALGFVPAFTQQQMLLGIFHVNAAHNIVHLLTGAVALASGMSGAHAAQIFFRVFGVIYGIVAILGFMQGTGLILGFLSNNVADAWLHAGIALVALVLGFRPMHTSALVHS